MVSIIIPVIDQLEVTKTCLESLKAHTKGGYEIIVIDNGSDASMVEYLKSQPVRLVLNGENRGCATAWNQGIRLSEGPWVCVMNNDIVVTDGWMENLMAFYQSRDFALVSPAMREGELNYDLENFSRAWGHLWKRHCWEGEFLGTCFLTHNSIYKKIGLFDENFKFGKFEDEDFYFRLREQGHNAAITGQAFIHHFGSRTIRTIREVRTDFEENNRRYFKQKWAHKYFARKWRKVRLARNHREMKVLIKRTEAYLATSKPNLVK